MTIEQREAIYKIVEEYFQPLKEQLIKSPNDAINENTLKELYEKLEQAPGDLLIINSEKTSFAKFSETVINAFNMSAMMADISKRFGM